MQSGLGTRLDSRLPNHKWLAFWPVLVTSFRNTGDTDQHLSSCSQQHRYNRVVVSMDIREKAEPCFVKQAGSQPLFEHNKPRPDTTSLPKDGNMPNYPSLRLLSTEPKRARNFPMEQDDLMKHGNSSKIKRDAMRDFGAQ